MTKKVYIAGPMTDLPNFNRDAFNKVAASLISDGHIPLNPAILPDGLEQKEYMMISGSMLYCADTIALLPGWEKSKGAVAEYGLALKLGIEILFIEFEDISVQ